MDVIGDTMQKFIRLSDNTVVTEFDLDPLCVNPSPNFRPNEEEYTRVQDAPYPAFDQYTQVVNEIDPVETDGVWTQQWEVVDLTGDELAAGLEREAADIQAKREAMVISMRQCRLQLLATPLGDSTGYAAVNNAIVTMGEAAQVDWEYAADVQRTFSLVVAMQQMFGWDDSQMDAFFVEAAKL